MSKITRFLIIFMVIAGWIFSGWPQIWNNPRIPSEVEKAQAAAPLPVFRAAGAESTGTGAVTPALPTGVAANDIVILVASTIAGGSISITANGSISSWTEITSGGLDVASGNKLYVWWGRYTSGSTGPTVTPGSDHIESATIAYSGVTTNDSPIDVSATGTETTSDTSLSFATGVSTTVDNTMVLLVTSNGIDNATNGKYSSEANTSLASIAERIDYNTSSGLGGGIMVSQGAKATAGTMGTWTATLSAASTKAYISFALKPPQLPTVTTQAASSVEATTATGNGNITDTGGQNATAWGVCYKTSSGCTTADSVAAGSGTGGTGAFTASMTSLSPGTTYYIRAYATNSAGTSYGSEVTILTKPAAPTSVAATKTLADKVTITWTKSTGATNYHVWRDAVDLGAAGDVATFDDTGAAAPTVTAGTASATDGSVTDRVTLSISGASANNGTSYTYKVVASNATGNSVDSATDTGYRAPGALTYQWYRSSGDADSGYSTLSGATTAPYDDTTAPASTITAGAAAASDGTSASYVALSVSGQSANSGAGRYFYATVSATGASSADTSHDRGYIGVGSLTYQWQRSAADSDASYSDISGATTASFNDTGAPADGSGRYFRVVENATGATQQISTADRGYRAASVVSVSVSDGVISYGTIPNNSTKSTCTSELNDAQTVTNNGNVTENFLIKGQNSANWTLAATAGSNQYVHKFLNGACSTFSGGTALTTSDQNFATGISPSGTATLNLQINTPNPSTVYTQQSVDVTITAVQQ